MFGRIVPLVAVGDFEEFIGTAGGFVIGRRRFASGVSSAGTRDWGREIGGRVNSRFGIRGEIRQVFGQFGGLGVRQGFPRADLAESGRGVRSSRQKAEGSRQRVGGRMGSSIQVCPT